LKSSRRRGEGRAQEQQQQALPWLEDGQQEAKQQQEAQQPTGEQVPASRCQGLAQAQRGGSS
jgi:hypothetical protein